MQFVILQIQYGKNFVKQKTPNENWEFFVLFT